MPMVGGKEYPYTAKGIAAAKKAAESKEDKNKRMMSKTALKNKLSKMGKSAGK